MPDPTLVLKPFKGRRPVVTVNIYEDRPAFQTALKDVFKVQEADKLAGYTCGYEPIEGRLKWVWATVCLDRTILGAGYVSHELAHAAFRVMERDNRQVRHWESDGLDLIERQALPEEDFCLALERMNAEFWDKAYALGYAR